VRAEILAEAAQLSARGEAFVLATVVWRRSPSSGQVGASALITGDGRVRGWLGGACAEPTVVREARRALEEGTPRLLFLGPPEELAGHERDGVLAVPIACQSEGAMEVHVEPVLPRPQLVAIGRSPAAVALTAMAAAFGWRSVAVDDGGEEADHPGAGRVLTTLDLTATGVDDRTFVVVATQGHYDEAALEQALATPAAYIGLIASRRRAEAVLGYLRDRGASEEALARVHAPAGIDLGRIDSEEIAVAVLAEIVGLKAEEGLHGRAPTGDAVDAATTHEELDPVCGMTVPVADARFRSVHEGRTYYFCSAGCQASFEADPARYAAVPR
jgi:xanthine dehydrogenase accessory factor